MEHHWKSLYQNRPLKSYSWYIASYKQVSADRAIINLTSALVDKTIRVTFTRNNGKFYAEPERLEYKATGNLPQSICYGPPGEWCEQHGEYNPWEPCGCIVEYKRDDPKAWPINNLKELNYFMYTFFGTELSPAPLQYTIVKDSH